MHEIYPKWLPVGFPVSVDLTDTLFNVYLINVQEVRNKMLKCLQLVYIFGHEIIELSDEMDMDLLDHPLQAGSGFLDLVQDCSSGSRIWSRGAQLWSAQSCRCSRAELGE